MQYKNILGLYLSLWITFSSCNKFVEPDFPNNQLSSENVYADNIAATSAMAGLYYRMIHSTGVFNGSVNSPGFLAGLSSDELLPAGSTGEIIQFAENNIITTNTSIASLWSGAYNYIFLANSIIEGAERSSALDSSLRRQLIGEAKFIRAFSHFYLQNLFGNVPYIKSTDYRVNTAAPRMDSTQVYTNMIEDLEAAYELLPDNFDAGGGEKIRVTKWAAAAMLARVYLYAGNWAEAERNATLIIENTGLFSLSTLTDAFLKNSTESIWQLKSVMPTRNTLEGFTFIPTGVPLYAYLRPSFADDFEDGDLRKTYWVGTIIVDAITYQFPFKYKIRSGGTPLDEYSMVLRLGEQYLIRAEARAHLNNISGSQQDIDILRTRAGLSGTSATDMNSLLDAIMQERRAELFTEWGHRWLDLKRTGRISSILPILKPTWSSRSVLYPIPDSEVRINPNMKQNTGY